MTYSYLVISVMVTLGGVAVAYAHVHSRWLILLSGALAAPAGLSDFLFVPEYWRPAHIVNEWLSVEGILFSFGNGCLIAAPLFLARAHRPVSPPVDMVRPLRRLTIMMAVGFAAFLVVWDGAFGSLMIMHAAFVGFAAMFIVLWLRGAARLWIGLRAGLVFAVIYAVETAIWYLIDPDFGHFWINTQAYIAALPVPPYLPIDEYLWAFLYGAIWVNLLYYAFCVEPRREPDVAVANDQRGHVNPLSQVGAIGTSDRS